jgi:hypothetical protein
MRLWPWTRITAPELHTIDQFNAILNTLREDHYGSVFL